MLKFICLTALIVLWARSLSAAPAKWDRMADTWAATDALGRRVSTFEQVGGPREGKFVGIFYFLWLGQHGVGGPYDIPKILAADPDAMSKPDSPLWGPKHAYHHWGEPLFGYYLSTDKWVIRRHAQMLADAGVDVVIFDCSNRATYRDSYIALCEASLEARQDGGGTPQIAFLCPFWDPGSTVRELYDQFYSKGEYSELWFGWKSKPLILADPEKVDEDIRPFFTFRKPQPDYFQGPTGPEQWGWLEKCPQHVFYDSEGRAEQMTVGVGQNTQGTRCCAFSEAGTYGRSTRRGAMDTRQGAVDLGLNVAEQWERALEVDPEFIFITGWNEWIAMRLDSFGSVSEPVMFVDQFTQEYSRDIEPMRGGHGDNYYYQMVDYIRRFKGARPAPKAGPQRTIRIDGRFDDWKSVEPEFRDEIGDTAHRDTPGWGSAGQLVNSTGRNDFVSARVARDDRFLYFYVRTRAAITPSDDPNWMMLLINTGRPERANWEGWDYIINRRPINSTTGSLERCTGGWSWEGCGAVSMRVSGAEMELAVPRAWLGLDRTSPLRFEFKWVDNVLKPGDPMEFSVHGDTAPNGRFAYRFVEQDGSAL